MPDRADRLDRFLPTGETLARSLLDRLVDLDPDLPADPPQPIGEQLRSLREGVRRDLEALLNTRRAPVTPPAGELSTSLLAYGVDGFFTTSLVTDGQRRAFAEALERRIRACEPRLSEVRVTALPPRLQGERSLRLRIEATLALRPGLPAVTFEAAVDPSTQRLDVGPDHG